MCCLVLALHCTCCLGHRFFLRHKDSACIMRLNQISRFVLLFCTAQSALLYSALLALLCNCTTVTVMLLSVHRRMTLPCATGLSELCSDFDFI
jgi:hypothetical protein